MNASQTQYRICGNNNNTEYSVNTDYCNDKCVKNCHEIYYSLELEDNTYSAQNDSKITIKHKISQEFHYKSEKKYSFVDYLSHMGGLIGLWFGMSFVDTSALIRLVLNSIRNIINYYMNIQLKLFILKIIQNINKLIKILLKYKLRKCMICLTLPIICYQIYILIDKYLSFSTQTSIEMIEYKEIDNKISLQSIPSITLCYENTFEDIFFDPYIRQYYITKLINKYIDPNSDVSKSITNSTLDSTGKYIKRILQYYTLYNMLICDSLIDLTMLTIL